MPEPTDPTPNLPLLRKVLAHIDAHPEEWDQEFCGYRSLCRTYACVAGHALILSGEPLDWSRGSLRGLRTVLPVRTFLPRVLDDAEQLLGLTPLESRDLFRGVNDRADVQRVAERIAARAGEAL